MKKNIKKHLIHSSVPLCSTITLSVINSIYNYDFSILFLKKEECLMKEYIAI